MKFGKTNIYAMVLQFVDSPAEYELRGVLDPLQSAIRAAGKRVERYAGIEEHEDQLMIDDECGYVEDLLGAVFVMAQRYLTVTASWMLRLLEHVKRDHGAPWSLPTKRYGLLSTYGPTTPHSNVRFAVAVNAAANFFKHESEWIRPWEDLDPDKPAGQTYQVVKTLGVDASSTGNLRSVAEGLGISDYEDLTPLVTGLDKWRIALLGTVRAELRALSLL